MPPKRDPNNPNAAHLAKPYHQARPMMREQSQSQRIRTSQARIATVNPGKITLPELPKWLREPERKRP